MQDIDDDSPLTPEELAEIRRNAEVHMESHPGPDCGTYFASACLALLDRLGQTEDEGD